jgi:hypothetical protein
VIASNKLTRWLLTISFFFLASCTPFVKDGQPTTNASTVTLRSGETVGQTFTARDRGLNGVQVYISPDATTNGNVQLHLRANSQSTTDIAMGTIAAQTVTAPGFYRFDFAPQRNSRQQDYYLTIEFLGGGALHVGTAPGDAYLDGALYQNDNPIDAQMAFRLAYDPVELAIGWAAQMLTWFKVSAIAVFLFVLPGWALLAFLLPTWIALSWGEKLGLAIGVSVAIYPVLLLWTDLIGLHLGSLYAWLPSVLAALALLWRYRAWRPVDISQSWRVWRQSKNVLPDLVFVLLIGAVVGVRFWVIRSIDLPMWGDSYQHTMITQLLIDHGGLFTSWQPYADLVTFTYHFGFHAASAMFHWVSGMEVPQAVLWTGQILNGLAVLALYPFAMRIGASRWAGVGAVLIAGLLSSMPMYYVNWGRYTQLAGQVILPVAIVLAWMVLDAKSRDWRLLGIAWVVFAGLGLAHYRILIFVVLFFATHILVTVVTTRKIIATLTDIFWLGLGGGLLFLPWFLRIFGGKIMLVLGAQLTAAPGTLSDLMQDYNALGDLTFFMPVFLWLFFVISIGWGLLRRDQRVEVIAIWCVLAFFSANPSLLHLPGEGAINNFAVFIAAYIPVSILVGGALGWLIDTKPLLQRNLALAGLTIAMAGLAMWGASQRLGEVHTAQGELATRSDLRAIDWIRQNTRADARFLVNSFFAYGNTVIVGSDGGWWLPLLAQRQTMLPPLTYASEQGSRPDYREWVNALPDKLFKMGIVSPDAHDLLRERGIAYIYIAQRQGRVNYDGTSILQSTQLVASPFFRPVYHQDRVWIFEVVE